MTSKRVHILGASGSGTTTLARELAIRNQCTHVDVDDFFWLPSDPPFETPRDRADRMRFLAEALDPTADWTLSGSLCGWGDEFIPRFTLVVFLWLPTELRLERLRTRERQRYGDAGITKADPLHARRQAFLDWAAAYDDGPLSMRSRRLRETWLDALPCPVLRLKGEMTLEERAAATISRLTELGGP
jgi:adenylate kinase family enzyme